MAGRDQLLLLVKRGTLLESFELLWTLSAKPKPAITVTNYWSGGAVRDIEVFKRRISKTEIDYSHEIEKALEKNEYPQLFGANVQVSLLTDDSAPSVEIDISTPAQLT